MRILNIQVRNYKSLKFIDFYPKTLSVLIGPNASGKTNFSDAIDFLSKAYRHGLETAIQMKGGYENIAFRTQRRTKSSLDFRIVLELDGNELFRHPRKRDKSLEKIRVCHSFSIKAPRGIKAEFHVVNEKYEICSFPVHFVDSYFDQSDFTMERSSEGEIELTVSNKKSRFIEGMLNDIKFYKHHFGKNKMPGQSLFVSSSNYFLECNNVARLLSSFSVFRLSSEHCKESSPPTPNPEMTPTGKRLPAMIDWLQRNHSRQWKTILSGMVDVLPRLEDINVVYLHDKTLGLQFKEEGFGRPWNVSEVSDGTIQTLALFVALSDPRSSLIVIEEPENSIHPWIINLLVKNFRMMCKEKTIILTTHSPVLIDQIDPGEAFIVSRLKGMTEIQPLLSLDSELRTKWLDGKIRLSEYLGGGFIPKAVPGGVA